MYVPKCRGVQFVWPSQCMYNSCWTIWTRIWKGEESACYQFLQSQLGKDSCFIQLSLITRNCCTNNLSKSFSSERLNTHKKTGRESLNKNMDQSISSNYPISVLFQPLFACPTESRNNNVHANKRNRIVVIFNGNVCLGWMGE
jgi:hypothetical protein